MAMLRADLNRQRREEARRQRDAARGAISGGLDALGRLSQVEEERAALRREGDRADLYKVVGAGMANRQREAGDRQERTFQDRVKMRDNQIALEAQRFKEKKDRAREDELLRAGATVTSFGVSEDKRREIMSKGMDELGDEDKVVIADMIVDGYDTLQESLRAEGRDPVEVTFEEYSAAVMNRWQGGRGLKAPDPMAGLKQEKLQLQIDGLKKNGRGGRRARPSSPSSVSAGVGKGKATAMLEKKLNTLPVIDHLTDDLINSINQFEAAGVDPASSAGRLARKGIELILNRMDPETAAGIRTDFADILVEEDWSVATKKSLNITDFLKRLRSGAASSGKEDEMFVRLVIDEGANPIAMRRAASRFKMDNLEEMFAWRRMAQAGGYRMPPSQYDAFAEPGHRIVAKFDVAGMDLRDKKFTPQAKFTIDSIVAMLGPREQRAFKKQIAHQVEAFTRENGKPPSDGQRYLIMHETLQGAMGEFEGVR